MRALHHRDLHAAAYSFAPHQDLTRDYPCFPIQNSPSRRQLVEYFQSRLTEPDAAFAEQFEGGWYEQDRSFVRNIGETLARSTACPLVLLDNQRFGFALVKAEIEDAVFDEKHALQKKVIIVEGPPGSGKPAIAAKVWASLAADSRIDAGRFVLTTTSSAQETNWRHLVQTVVGRDHGAGGIVLPANKYAPGTLQELTWLKDNCPGMIRAPAFWRQNLQARKKEKGDPWMPDNHLAVSVVDEAHALINPEHPRAITHSGWPNPFGPQAYHIIRASTVSVFFSEDPEQRFRERESTSPADIEEWAKESSAQAKSRESRLPEPSFGVQVRLEYVSWVEALLVGAPSHDCAQLSKAWMPQAASAKADRTC